jgi:aminopeptidase
VKNSRLAKLADICVNFSTKIKPGDYVRIAGDYKVADSFINLLYEKTLEAGGNPMVDLKSDRLRELFYKKATKDQLEWIATDFILRIEKIDVNIMIVATENTKIFSNVPLDKQTLASAALKDITTKFFKRAAAGEARWTAVQYPCVAFAQEADMSLEEYEDFVYGATFADQADPVSAWQKMHNDQEKIIQWLKGKDLIEIKGPSCDLRMSVKDRTWVNCSGLLNMPDGEIFTGPVEDSVNGWVEFNYPDASFGREVDGIRLKFKDGKVIKASAEKGDDFLNKQLDIDEAARYVGELGIGTNYGIDRFTKHMLFDEKIGGTFHLALGAGYPETGSKLDSAIHWDMLCDIKNDSEIRADGDLLYKDGVFVVG